ncbi:MAG: iron chelate uptake ABC transporter family permease subunit, partial [Sediminispirochaetaceae bacterium]
MHEILFRQRARLLFLSIVLLAVMLLAVLAGRYPRAGLISPWAAARDPLAMSLILGLRLPRVIAAVVLGAGLAAAGTVFQ